MRFADAVSSLSVFQMTPEVGLLAIFPVLFRLIHLHTLSICESVEPTNGSKGIIVLLLMTSVMRRKCTETPKAANA